MKYLQRIKIEKTQIKLIFWMMAAVFAAVLEPFSVKPYVLFFGDIVEDSTDWVNYSVGDYFGKKSVALKPQEGSTDAEN